MLMIIRPDDKCEGCQKRLWNYEGTIHSCRTCGARFCDDCIKHAKDQHEGKCLRCGRDR